MSQLAGVNIQSSVGMFFFYSTAFWMLIYCYMLFYEVKIKHIRLSISWYIITDGTVRS